jgi:hypothetical protein
VCDLLPRKEQADPPQRSRRCGKESIVVPTTAAEPVPECVKGQSWNKRKVEFNRENRLTPLGIRFKDPMGSASDKLAPVRELMPGQARLVTLPHGRQRDTFPLRPGFLNERPDVRFARQGGKQRHVARALELDPMRCRAANLQRRQRTFLRRHRIQARSQGASHFRLGLEMGHGGILDRNVALRRGRVHLSR